MYCIPLGLICVICFYTVSIIVFLACTFYELRAEVQVQIDAGVYATVVLMNSWCYCIQLILVMPFGGLQCYMSFGIGVC